MAFVVLDTTVTLNRGISPVETEFWVGLGTCARIETAMLINTSRSLKFDICPLLMLLSFLRSPLFTDSVPALTRQGLTRTIESLRRWLFASSAPV